MKRTRTKRTKKNEERLRELWDVNKQINIYLVRVPEEEEREKEAERFLKEIIPEYFQNLE